MPLRHTRAAVIKHRVILEERNINNGSQAFRSVCIRRILTSDNGQFKNAQVNIVARST